MSYRDKDGYIRGGKSSKLAHLEVAEKALGKPLPPGAVVHHVDGNRTNNVASNLVICPSQSYHQILHRRQAAYEACGNPNFRSCIYCKEYDDTSNMTLVKSTGWRYHKRCAAAYQARLSAKRKGVSI